MPFCKTSVSAQIHYSGSPVTQKETSHCPSQALAPTMELLLFQDNVEPLTTQKEKHSRQHLDSGSSAMYKSELIYN